MRLRLYSPICRSEVELADRISKPPPFVHRVRPQGVLWRINRNRLLTTYLGNNSNREEADNEQDSWHRLGHDELRHGRHGGFRARNPRERRGRPHHSVCRGLPQGRRARRGQGREEPGRHEPREHRVVREALHRPLLRRDAGRAQDRQLQAAEGQGRPRGGRHRRQGLHAGGNLRHGTAEAEERRREAAGLPGDAGRHHGARVLQRRAAPGHEGRRQDRGPRSAPHHQRAHGRRAGLRPRQDQQG